MGNAGKRVKGAAKEIGGKVEKKVGKLVGSERMQAEGHAHEVKGREEKDAAKARERAKGKAEEMAGRLEGSAGEFFGDDEMRTEGELRRLRGETRQKTNR